MFRPFGWKNNNYCTVKYRRLKQHLKNVIVFIGELITFSQSILFIVLYAHIRT